MCYNRCPGTVPDFDPGHVLNSNPGLKLGFDLSIILDFSSGSGSQLYSQFYFQFKHRYRLRGPTDYEFRRRGLLLFAEPYRNYEELKRLPISTVSYRCTSYYNERDLQMYVRIKETRLGRPSLPRPRPFVYQGRVAPGAASSYIGHKRASYQQNIRCGTMGERRNRTDRPPRPNSPDDCLLGMYGRSIRRAEASSLYLYFPYYLLFTGPSFVWDFSESFSEKDCAEAAGNCVKFIIQYISRSFIVGFENDPSLSLLYELSSVMVSRSIL
ncbi:hypothetical protein EVAR_93844_1 [Eumeta japonica]|uniref:Uncharacterized protein n=1 Tax=Eumeta variegata TaxID=151549 RepID=A0A4C1TWL4_EUMVA|nr:hypothetical protein EVAR_93844_1 [Eumeta japonica]